jgi:hypothetical protein
MIVGIAAPDRLSERQDEYREAWSIARKARGKAVIEVVGVGFFDYLHDYRGRAHALSSDVGLRCKLCTHGTFRTPIVMSRRPTEEVAVPLTHLESTPPHASRSNHRISRYRIGRAES